MKNYLTNLKRSYEFEGSISYNIKDLMAQGIRIENYGLKLNRIRVIEQRDGSYSEYIDVPISLARHLNLVNV